MITRAQSSKRYAKICRLSFAKVLMPLCRTLTQEDWENNILPLTHDAKYPMLNQAGMNLDLDLFRIAASWVASRAFGVDNYHGKSRVLISIYI